MSFTGFSSDQEGSIVYDGEKFIINNPEKVPENFDSGGKPVIYTRPPAPKPPASTTPNSQPAPATTHQQNNMLNQDFNYVVAGVGEPKDKKKNKKKKRDALAAGSGEQAIAGFSEHEGIRDISEAGLIDFEPEEATSLTGYTAVSEGQRQHIDYLLSIVDDDLAWVALVVVKEYGLPSKEQIAEYMAQFAESGLDDKSDRRALELLDEVRHSDWDKRLAQADSAPVETTAQDLADNTIEGLTVIEAKTGRTLLNRPGVLGAGGQQYVGLQDYEVEAFKGLDLIFIHNHPNGSDASEADLRAAFAAGAEMLMVVTPQGYEYVYIRGPRGMIRIRAEEASYEVAPGTAQEHALLESRSWAQARADRLNPPEWMMWQEEQYVAVHVKGNLNLYGNEETVLRSEAIPDWSFSIDETRLRVLDQSPSDPYAVKIEFGGSEFWIDLRDPDAELEFRRVDLASSPFTSRRVQVSGQIYDNTSLDFLNALTEALIPHPIGVMKVSGTLRIYIDEEFDPNVDKPVSILTGADPSVPFSVYEFSKQNPGLALVKIGDQKYWIDTNDRDAVFDFVPLEKDAATVTPPGYEILPIIPDEKAHGGPLDIEISDRPWADRTTSKLGVRTRDYNRRRDIYDSFRLQSPVIGPDVRVEFVVTGHKDLGNYVVISFPSFVYQSNDEIMRQLEWQGLAAQRLRDERSYHERLVNSVDHNPDRWHEDGRIFYAFAHLSEIYVSAGEIIDSESKAIIGKTGNTGKEGITHHLDLAILYIGSSHPGSGAMEEILNDKRKRFEDTGSRSVEYFFDLAQMSQLYPNGVSVLYAENLESARIHPELDEFKIAEFPTSEGDPNASIYFEDE